MIKTRIIFIKFICIVLSCTALKAEIILNEPILPIPEPEIIFPEQVELGRLLFNDVRLSKGAQVSCASCHSLKMGGADGQKVSTGVNSQKGPINSPTVFNSSLNFRQFWNGRAENLMEQVDGPIANPKEMNFSWQQAIEIIRQDPFYAEKFKQAYADGLTILNMRKAIVKYEESLLTPNGRFDQYLRGNRAAITDDELKGYALFKQYGCISCHQGVAVGANLYQKFGVFGDYFADRGNVTEVDFGRFLITKKERDRFVFKVPSLRNVELTAPYFHDASQDQLEGAVKMMMKYQLGRIPKENNVRLIVQFLKTLTGLYKGEVITEN